ncbi:phage tail family protein [Clostridium gasigenes]|uniref:distal tail protein Dit n=1 Tax=Clostridium gasigenes TaxID=94869 RepID=UPI001625AB57|nr:distal tail protein Dit [Clostridium gasigenes]MBB6622572.1 phage tail family protein [Clostridium gasigenes]
MHKYNIHFNNTSALDLGIYAIKRPNVPIPERNIEEKEIKGRDSSLISDYKTYKNISIDVEFNFLESRDFLEKCRAISKWLNNIEDYKLNFTDNPSYFFKVKYVKCKDIVRDLKIKGSFTVNFICEPFQYSKDGQDEIILTNNSTLYNPYFIVAKPIVKLWGEGIIKLNLNGNILEINLGQSIIIDCKLEEAFRTINSKKDYQNTKLKGEYPVLIEGNNNISWTLNIGARLDKTTIQPNFKTI